MMPNRYSQAELDRFKPQLAALEGMLGSGFDVHGALQSLEAWQAGFNDFYQRYQQERREAVAEVPVGQGAGVAVEERSASWYSGARTGSGVWPRYRDRVSAKLPQSAVETIDSTTGWILGACANPLEPGDRRKGLVIGFVQSGKTANYSGLIAKSVDAGYRIVIVLAGMYSNLREQTQVRLAKDLAINESHDDSAGGVAFVPATSASMDIGRPDQFGALNNRQNVLFMVVKKNPTRLRNVADFLDGLSESIRSQRAVLIVDDESDQATPNTLRAKNEISTINGCLREIWSKVRVGSYVAYTATPFANIFIDPDDNTDLYPEDFAFALPKPQGYMGSREFFDLDDTLPEDGGPADRSTMSTDLAIEIPEAEADELKAAKADLEDYAPEVKGSLEEAIRWFAIATALRRMRAGRVEHSSMLVHMSHFVDAHMAQKDALDEFRLDTGLDLDAEERAFREVYGKQIERGAAYREVGVDAPDWGELWPAVKETWRSIRVVVDNGRSTDRLNYPDGDPQTVIAVGGGTLSRGLTLEGLVVSYFLRSSNTYDTLLQMGRWFGFRPGYQDLTRVWVGPGLLEEFRFLAQVEEELRAEVHQMMEQGLSPKQLGVKIRNHPGRLEITGRNRMAATRLVGAGLGGQRYQSTYLDISEQGVQRSQETARSLVAKAAEEGTLWDARHEGGPRLITDVSSRSIVDFLEQTWVPDVYPWIQSDVVARWLSKEMPDATWNVVLASPGGRRERADFDFGPGITVRTSVRSRVSDWSEMSYKGREIPEGADLVNIRALLSDGDIVSDLRVMRDASGLSEPQQELTDTWLREAARRTGAEKLTVQKRARQEVIPGQGLLILYAIDPDSAPSSDSATRSALDAPEVPVAFGIVFPALSDPSDEGDFYAVVPPAERFAEVSEEDEDDDLSMPIDDEGDFTLPGNS